MFQSDAVVDEEEWCVVMANRRCSWISVVLVVTNLLLRLTNSVSSQRIQQSQTFKHKQRSDHPGQWGDGYFSSQYRSDNEYQPGVNHNQKKWTSGQNYDSFNYNKPAEDDGFKNPLDLKTSPLTSPRNKSGLGLYSKWGAERKREVGPNSNSIESSLAAIFRGVAYGVSSAPTTSTTTSTTTTTTTEPARLEESNTEAETQDNGVLEVGDNQPVDAFNFDEDSRLEVIPSSVSPTALPTEVSRAGLEDWHSSLEGAWEVHVYCSAASFSMLAIISLLCIVRVNMSNYLLPRGYYVTAHLLVFLSSFFRCIIFFHDPYASSQKLPVALSDVLFNTGIPCITAAFSVVVLALLSCAGIILLPLNLQSPLVFGIISFIYISSSIVTDVLAGVFSQYEWSGALRASVQALTAGWTAAMCLGYMIIFYRIEKVAARQRNDIMRLSYARNNSELSASMGRISAYSLSRAARLILVASFCGLALAVLQVYGLMTPDALIHLPPKEPWIWFGFQTSCRLLEIIMWSCICVAAALSACSSTNKRTSEEQSLTVFSCKNCTSCSDISSCQESSSKKINEDMYPTVCQTNLKARNYSVDLNGKMICEDGRTLPRLTNTIGPDNDKVQKNTATLHSANSDMHLLYGGHYSNSTTSRPASMIFNENGMVRFRTQMDGNEYQDILQVSPYGKGEMPPGYAEQVYNLSQYPNNESSDGPQLTRISTRTRENKQVRETPDGNNDYNYCDVPNDQYARFGSGYPSAIATNADSRIYDDYEVASYYHSPINGAKSTTSSHVYASLHPTQPCIPNRFTRTLRTSNNSCFSSPQSGASSVHTNQSPRLSNHHTSDSDLCSSATDRTQASSSQGYEDNSEKYDNINVNFGQPQLRRHLSHPNAMADHDVNLDSPRKFGAKNNVTLDHSENRNSPSDSDDIYTPLMDQQQQSQCSPYSPLLQSERLTVNLNRPYHYQSPECHASRVHNKDNKTQNGHKFQETQYNFNSPARASQNQSSKCSDKPRDTGASAVFQKGSSPVASQPTSPVYLNNEVEQMQNQSINSRSCRPSPTDMPPSIPRINNNQSNSTSAHVNTSREQQSSRDCITSKATGAVPPPIPQRPSLTETWVHQSSDGLPPRTEFVGKGKGSKNNLALASPTRSTSLSSNTVVSNI